MIKQCKLGYLFDIRSGVVSSKSVFENIRLIWNKW